MERLWLARAQGAAASGLLMVYTDPYRQVFPYSCVLGRSPREYGESHALGHAYFNRGFGARPDNCGVNPMARSECSLTAG